MRLFNGNRVNFTIPLHFWLLKTIQTMLYNSPFVPRHNATMTSIRIKMFFNKICGQPLADWLERNCKIVRILSFGREVILNCLCICRSMMLK